jgi:putative molybdopterin biosynthesis protein
MNDIPTALRSLARQEQFLDVVDRDTATARFHRHLKLRPLGAETVPLSQALGRVLARAVIADVDVPGFDRASVDGFAVRADDTVGASERTPKALALNGEILTPGTVPQLSVGPGTATLIATGGMVPRGADAVIMVEHTETRDDDGSTVIEVRRAAAAGQFIAFAGSDLARGETVLRRPGFDLARDWHAGGGRLRGCRSLAAAADSHHLDRRRDRRTGRADPPGRGL